MITSVRQSSQRVMSLLLTIMLLLGMVTTAFTVKPAHAAYHQAYIQTTIDVSIWEVLAGTVDVSSGWFSDALEYQRIGGSTLSSLAATTTPSEAAGYINNSPSGGGGSPTQNLVMVFPGDANSNGGLTRDSSTSKDMARATLVRNSLVYDLNNAFKFVYGSNYTPSGSDTPSKVASYRDDMQNFLGHISGSDNSSASVSYQFYSGHSAQFEADLSPRVFPDAVTEYSDYVCITKDGDSQYFLYRMPKGYVSISGRDLSPLDLTSISSSNDTAFVHWGHFAVEAFINYSCDDKIKVTTDEVYSSTPSAFEKAIAGFLSTIINWVIGSLGVWSFDEVIFNSGVRGTSSWVGGVFPSSWQPLIWTFFFLSEILAIGILLYSILFTIGKKAMSTVNPIVRASAMEQIQYLFIVAILLGVLPIALQLLLSVNAELTGIFADALGDKSATQRFEGLASNSGGLGAVLTYLIYLGAVVYFSIFYEIRSWVVAILIILAPAFIACLGLGENKRNLTMAWAKELMANLFIQPIQALILCFIIMAPSSGRNISSIAAAYVLIPITHIFRNLIFGNSGGLINQIADKGKQQVGRMAAMAGGTAIAGAAGGVSAGISAMSNRNRGEAGEAEGSSGSSDTQTSGGANVGPSPGMGPTSGLGSTSARSTSYAAADTSESSGLTMSGASDSTGTETLSHSASTTVTAGTIGSPSALSESVREGFYAGQGSDQPLTGVNSDVSSPVNTDIAPGSSSVSDESISRGVSAVQGAGYAAAAVGLGALGGATSHINRRVFGISPQKGGGIVTQLSRTAANRANEKFYPSSSGDGATQGESGGQQDASMIPQPATSASGAYSEPSSVPTSSDSSTPGISNTLFNPAAYASSGEASDNIYTSGAAEMTPMASADSYYVAPQQFSTAGIGGIQRGDNGTKTVTFHADKMSSSDSARAGAMLHMWEHGSASERSAMQSAGIENIAPTTRFVGGQAETTGVSIQFNEQVYKKEFGVDMSPKSFGGKGIEVTTPKGQSPQLVPDIGAFLQRTEGIEHSPAFNELMGPDQQQ